MAYPTAKKRKLFPLSGQDTSTTYAQDIAGHSFPASTNSVRGNEPHQTFLAAMNQAGGNVTASWDSGIYDATMFKLKTNELLARVQPDYERWMVMAENSIRKLKDTIGRIPDRQAKPVCLSPFLPLARQTPDFPEGPRSGA